MNKLRRVWLGIIALEIVILILGNIIYINKANSVSGRSYRVEASRLVKELDNASPETVDMSKYESLLFVKEYNPRELTVEDYLVESVGDKLYLIAYREAGSYMPLIIMNVSMAAMIVVTLILYIYVSLKIIKPFHNMSEFTTSLAKGNLTTPLKQEKSKYFGKFIWGLDMLRENLEDNKEKELNLQKEKKTLILSLSHDIKTPLSAIELYTKALESGLYDTDEKKQAVYGGIHKNIGEIRDYVNQITKASREDFLNLEVVNSEVYLKDVISFVEVYYKDRLSVVHTEFTVAPYENCLVKGDRDRLIEVMQNIIENAMKYGDGSSISLSVSEEEDCKLITISNTGNTLKEEELPHIFESFYRGTNGEGSKGSGLGLFICKNLMRLMDGDIFGRVSGDLFEITMVIRKA